MHFLFLLSFIRSACSFLDDKSITLTIQWFAIAEVLMLPKLRYVNIMGSTLSIVLALQLTLSGLSFLAWASSKEHFRRIFIGQFVSFPAFYSVIMIQISLNSSSFMDNIEPLTIVEVTAYIEAVYTPILVVVAIAFGSIEAHQREKRKDMQDDQSQNDQYGVTIHLSDPPLLSDGANIFWYYPERLLPTYQEAIDTNIPTNPTSSNRSSDLESLNSQSKVDDSRPPSKGRADASTDTIQPISSPFEGNTEESRF